jgi:hypothetical protein
MPKQAISTTLEADNIRWLKGRVAAGGLRSVSDLLDQLVTSARRSGHIGAPTSVVGTIDLDSGDPLLEGADRAVRALFAASLDRPLTAMRPRGRPRARRKAMGKRRG